MGRVVIPGFRKIETSTPGGEGTTNYADLSNKPSINNVPLVGNLKTVDLKLTDATLTEEGVPAEAKTVGQKLEEQSTSLTALSEQLGKHTVKSDVPENAVFTDTVYDDTEIQKRISDNGYGDGSLSNNIMGTDSNIYYCPLEKNSTITISKKNTNDIFPASPQDKILRLHQCDNDGTIIESWQIYDSLLPRTISIIKPSMYLKWSYDISDKPLMVNLGKSSLPYEPYIPSNKMLAEENSQQSREMMDIKMLGWSVPRECPIQNEVTGNQFVQKVGRIDLGSLEWDTTPSGLFRTVTTNEDIKPVETGTIVAKIYLYNYKTVGAGPISGTDTINEVAINNDTRIFVNDIHQTDPTAFKSAMQGQYLYYELATYNTITIDGNEEVVEIKQDVEDAQSTLTTVISDIANIRNDYVSKLYYTNRNTPYVTADENAIVATSTGSASMSPKLINETLAEIAVTGADINNIVFDEQLKCTGLSVNIPDDGVTRYVYIETSPELQSYVKTGIFRLTQQSTGSKVTIRNIDGYSYYETTKGLSGTIPIIIPQGTKLSGETYIFVYITDKLKTPLDERFMSLGRSTYNNIDNIKTTQNELNTILADINTYMETISETSSDYKIGSYLQSVVQKLVDLSISK